MAAPRQQQQQQQQRLRVVFAALQSCFVALPSSWAGALLDARPGSASATFQLTWQMAPRATAASVYVGWAGATVSSARSQGGRSGQPPHAPQDMALESLEMDAMFGAALGLVDGQLVSLTLQSVTALPTAVSISVEPASEDDWEVLELNAAQVEAQMLSQIRVVFPGQTFVFWLRRTTPLRLRVVAAVPAAAAVLLDRDSEVYVAPKLRATLNKGDGQCAVDGTASGAPGASKRAVCVRAVMSTTRPTVHPDVLAMLGVQTDDATAVLAFEAQCQPKGTGTADKTMGGAAAAEGDSHTVRLATRSLVVDANATRVQTALLPAVVLARIGVEDGMLVRITSTEAKPSTDLVSAAPPVALPSDALVGVDDVIDSGAAHLKSCLETHPLAHIDMPAGPHGLLLIGRRGFGKTVVATALAKATQRAIASSGLLHAAIHTVSCADLAGQSLATTTVRIRAIVEQAALRAPCILVLDDLDRLAPAAVEHSDSSTQTLIAGALLETLRCAVADHHIVLLATAQDRSAIHTAIGSSGLLGLSLSLKAPDKMTRIAILDQLIDALADTLERDASLDVAQLSHGTEGYLARDLRQLVERALFEATMRQLDQSGDATTAAAATLAHADFTRALEGFVPLSLRGMALQASGTNWADIGGLVEVRRILRETLEFPSKYAPIFASCKLRLRSGILLYGFPGCGKTMLASAVARECGLNFVSVKGPELLNKYIGASEQSVRDLFERAASAKPCVLFFDEFESIAPRRGHDNTGVTDRVVNQFLTQMDGAEGLDGVYVLAATSRPDLIDPALLRPGRLDKSLCCGMPTREERLDILTKHARTMRLSADVSLDDLAGMTDGMTGADLQAVLYNAYLMAIHDAASVAQSGPGDAAEATAATATTASDNVLHRGAGRLDARRDIAIVEDSVCITLNATEERELVRRIEDIRSDVRNANQTQTGAAGPADSAITQTTRVEPQITPQHIERSIAEATPSLTGIEHQRLANIYAKFTDNRSTGKQKGGAPETIGVRESLG